MSRKFTSDGVPYKGFNRDFSHSHILILVLEEDVMSTWALDEEGKEENFNNFCRFLKNRHIPSKIVGLYRQDGFRGVLCEEGLVATARSSLC